MPQLPPQILVDVSVIYRHDARTGIQRVVRGILLQLIKRSGPECRVRPVFARRDQGYHYANLDFLNDSSTNAAWRTIPTTLVQCGKGDIFLGLDLAAHLLPCHRTQVARWKAAGAAVHVIVYDLLPVRQGQWFERKTVRNFTRWLHFLGRHCDGAICISHSTRRDLSAWLERHYPKRVGAIPIDVIRLGADIAATAPSRGLCASTIDRLAQRGQRPFILMVGTVEPRKGYEVAIRGFEQLWTRAGDAAPDLVIVGRPGWKTEALQRHIRARAATTQKLCWFDDASDELLDRLYKECQGVITTAYAEGFGLPVDEAGRCGKPVLARDLPVFLEAGRPAITCFHDDADFAPALARWIEQLPRLTPTKVETRGWDMTSDDLWHALGLDKPRRDGSLQPLAPAMAE